MTTPYRVLADKPFESHYVWEQIDIQAPASTVFKRARQIENWMNAHRFEALDGKPGEVGRFERIHPDLPPDSPGPGYNYYGIGRLIPDHYIGLEVFPEHGGSYGSPREWIAVDSIILTTLSPTSTRVTFLSIDAQLGHGSQSEYEAHAAEGEEMRTTLIAPYLRTLKDQCEEPQ